MAAQSHGATCTANRAAFKPDVGCYGALDGSVIGSNANDNWKFYGEGLGTTFTITFNDTYEISEFNFMQPYWADEKNFKMLLLTFSDGSTYEVSVVKKRLFGLRRKECREKNRACAYDTSSHIQYFSK